MKKTYVKKARVLDNDTNTINGLLDWLDPNDSVKFTFKDNHYVIEFSDGCLSCLDAECEFKQIVLEEVY